ncbi:hypothetical protein ELE36_07090 [Pseudolysobacter antarcticus]|uniref:Delta-60 repeat domain-containing protein n=1 Tax=Pseudolysobacter antarcticus TaxID=2511995 RepID=A0A411HI06_9GAMM|nr:hypothetical protein [Pseudolysobacter antarcticus]QBB70148.1 hypothetical protein ELE36_07090 [Pseudolysobacter antarcticus]
MTNPFARMLLNILLGVSLLLQASLCGATEGAFDPTFGSGGRLLVSAGTQGGDQPIRMVQRSDGKILMSGTCDYPYPGGAGYPAHTFCVTQLLADGSYDGNFGPGGVGYLDFNRFASWPLNSYLVNMILLQDGRIALLGYQLDSNNNLGHSMLLGILLADGSALDTSVGAGNGYLLLQFGGAMSDGSSLVQQTDGKVLVAGDAIGINGNQDFAVGRLLADLSGLDASFGSGGSQTVAFDLGGPGGDDTDVAESVSLQSDGKIVLAGFSVSSAAGATTVNTTRQAALTRLNVDGTRDLTFGSAGDGRVHYAAGQGNLVPVDSRIDASNRIVLAGVAEASGATTTQWLMDRLSPDGSRDFTFNGGQPQLFAPPPGYGGYAFRLALTNDGIFAIGNVLRATQMSTNYFAVVRLDSNGAFDSKFGNAGRIYASFTSNNDTDTSGIDIAVGKAGLTVFGQQVQSSSSGTTRKFGVGRLQYDQIFANDFGQNITVVE